MNYYSYIRNNLKQNLSLMLSHKPKKTNPGIKYIRDVARLTVSINALLANCLRLNILLLDARSNTSCILSLYMKIIHMSIYRFRWFRWPCRVSLSCSKRTCTLTHCPMKLHWRPTSGSRVKTPNPAPCRWRCAPLSLPFSLYTPLVCNRNHECISKIVVPILINYLTSQNQRVSLDQIHILKNSKCNLYIDVVGSW